MKITNLKTFELNLGFIEPNGIKLAGSASVVVPDKYSGHSSLLSMRDNGIVSLSSYDMNDAPTTSPFSLNPFDAVSIEEFNTYLKGIYQIKSTWSKSGTVQASATAYSITNTDSGPYNLTSKYVLSFKFDSLYEVPVTLPTGVIDMATVISTLNDNTTFAKYGLAEDATEGELHFIKISSKAVGVNSKVEFLDNALSCVEELYFDDPTIVAGTKTVATATFQTVGPSGVGIKGISHTVQLRKKAAAGAGDGNSAEFTGQRVSVGTVTPSTLNTSELTILTGDDGVITFEVTTDGAITEDGCWLDISIPTAHYLAAKPATRLQIA